jgi:7-cyano-7-deazaguanine synthase
MAGAILLSGGTDSTALAYWKRDALTLALTINYGQVCAQAEIDAATEICGEIGLPHEVLSLDCRALGGGSLAGGASLSHAPTPEWWPFRNQFLITVAAMRSVRGGVQEILVGTVDGDGRHADGRREFIALMDQLLHMQEGGLRLVAPAQAMTSAELVRASGVPRKTLAWTYSCHRGNIACGQCRGCFKHETVMRELGWLA